MGLKNLIYITKQRAKTHNYTKEEFETDVATRKIEWEKERILNKKREMVYLLTLHENENKRCQSYQYRKEIKAGKRESYRIRKFKAWQERKKSYKLNINR